MYQVIALDLDGTVLNDHHQIQPDVKHIIQQLKQDHHVVIVTGRHHTAAQPYYTELGLKTPVICCNGTYVYDYASNKVLTHNGIDKEKAHRLWKFIQKHNLKSVLYVTDKMVFDRNLPVEYMQNLHRWALTQPADVRPNIEEVDGFEPLIAHSDHIWKFVVEGDDDYVRGLMDEPWFQVHFDAEKSWHNRIDITVKGNSKGNRLAEYLQTIDISPKNVIAFGDNHNDISMLSLVGQGVAMAHADPKVKACADQICTTNNNGDGIAKLLTQYFHINSYRINPRDSKMTKPMIQIALDQTNLSTAVEVAKNVQSYVDIIEVGTILAFAEGMNAVSTIRKNHPDHIIVCDMKTTDGGAILAKMAFEAGADWITVSAAAHIATIEACKKVADEFGGEIQIEIYGNWTFEDAQRWVDLGIKQAIYHRSRDAELAGIGWTQEDINKMHKLSEMGIELSITGGIVPEDMHLFEGIKAKAFIAGRALVGERGQATAEAIRAQIDRFWK